MDELSKEYLISFYTKNFSFHGDTPAALRWTPEGQAKRYKMMLRATDLRGKKILDYGCGKGDFYGFLKDMGIRVDYTGFDITPSLIEFARGKYPECRFNVFDIEDSPLMEEFDCVFLCGVFNNLIEDAEDSLREIIKRLFAITKEVLVFDVLTGIGGGRDLDLNVFRPEDIVSFSLKITPHAVFSHGEVEGTLICFLYKR